MKEDRDWEKTWALWDASNVLSFYLWLNGGYMDDLCVILQQKFIYNMKTKPKKALTLQTLWPNNSTARDLAHGNN